MPKIPAALKTAIAALSATQAANTASVATGAPRQWVRLAPARTPSALHTALDRAEVDQEYNRLRASPEALAKDLHAVKLAGDTLAAYERDWSLRTRSRVRTLAHAAARVKAAGTGGGPLRQSTLGYFGRIAAESEV